LGQFLPQIVLFAVGMEIWRTALEGFLLDFVEDVMHLVHSNLITLYDEIGDCDRFSQDLDGQRADQNSTGHWT
jgi:hypothetical protein